MSIEGHIEGTEEVLTSPGSSTIFLPRGQRPSLIKGQVGPVINPVTSDNILILHQHLTMRSLFLTTYEAIDSNTVRQALAGYVGTEVESERIGATYNGFGKI